MEDYKSTLDLAILHLLKQMGSAVIRNISKICHQAIAIRFEDWDEVVAFATPPERRKASLPTKEIAAIHHPDGLNHIVSDFDPSKQVMLRISVPDSFEERHPAQILWLTVDRGVIKSYGEGDYVVAWKDMSIYLSQNGLCGRCGQPASLTCAKCLRVKYCSKSCQRTVWKTHKPICMSS